MEKARREDGPFRSLYDLWRRTRLSRAELSRLAAADALASLMPASTSRREALGQVHALPVDEGDSSRASRRPPSRCRRCPP